MIQIGTNHFRDRRSVDDYFAFYGYSQSDVAYKLAQGDVNIGKPKLLRGQRDRLNDDRRYVIVDDLETDQRKALESFMERHGRQWKETLLSYWLNGKDAQEPGGHLLRQIRNRLGPQWLEKF